MKVRLVLTALISMTGLLFISGQASGTNPTQDTIIDTTEMEHTRETATKILRTEQIREMQTLLQDRGYAVGDINGLINAETTQALLQFQKDRGLAVTGTPTRETLRALSLSTAQQEFFGVAPPYGEIEEKPGQKQMEKELEEGLY